MSSTRHHFEEEIQALCRKLLEMGAATEEMVRDAVLSLVNQDIPLAESIIPRDDAVDQMDQDIEAHCLRLLALQQPMATDLRVIGTALKMIADIERIGDHAVDISKIARRIARDSPYKPLVDIPKMGEMARGMLRDALEAFVQRDMELVQKVIDSDDAVDSLYAQMRDDLQRVMEENPASVVQASHLLFVAHYLERICDHCTNIAERVNYIETGQVKDLQLHEAPESGPPNLRMSVG